MAAVEHVSSVTTTINDEKELENLKKEIESGEKMGEIIDLGSDEKSPVFVAEDEIVKLVLKFRQELTSAQINTKIIEDSTLIRFLRARGLDVEKAKKMYLEHINWRTTFVPKTYFDESDILNEKEAKKAFLQVKEGHRSIIVLHSRKHDSSKRDLEEFKRFAVYALDKAIASLPPGEGKFCVVLDMASAGQRSLDGRAMVSVFQMLQAHYPERLGRLFMVHVPYIFWGIWKLVSPFVDKVTKSKIVFVEDKSLTATLLAECPEDMISPEYGGKGVLIPVQDVIVPGWPLKLKPAET